MKITTLKYAELSQTHKMELFEKKNGKRLSVVSYFFKSLISDA